MKDSVKAKTIVSLQELEEEGNKLYAEILEKIDTLTNEEIIAILGKVSIYVAIQIMTRAGYLYAFDYPSLRGVSLEKMEAFAFPKFLRDTVSFKKENSSYYSCVYLWISRTSKTICCQIEPLFLDSESKRLGHMNNRDSETMYFRNFNDMPLEFKKTEIGKLNSLEFLYSNGSFEVKGIASTREEEEEMIEKYKREHIQRLETEVDTLKGEIKIASNQKSFFPSIGK